MRIVLLGRKPSACNALRYMLQSRCFDVVAVVTAAPTESDPYSEQLWNTATALGVPTYACRPEPQFSEFLSHTLAPEHPDLGVSVLYDRRIREPFLSLPKLGIVNFHPGPLPEYRGWGPYNIAVLESVKEWGVSAHVVDEGFDTGPIIQVNRFELDGSEETAFGVYCKTQRPLLDLFKTTLASIATQGKIVSQPQGPGRYFSKQDVLAHRRIRTADSDELIDRKIRAFFYPPYEGAQLGIGGSSYSILSQDIMSRLGRIIHSSGLDRDRDA